MEGWAEADTITPCPAQHPPPQMEVASIGQITPEIYLKLQLCCKLKDEQC